MSTMPQYEPVEPLGARVVYPPHRASGEPWDARGVAYWVALSLTAGCDAAGCGVEQVLRPLSHELTRLRPDLFPPAPHGEPVDIPPAKPSYWVPWWRRQVFGEAVLSWLGAAATVVLVVVIVAGGLLGWWG